MHQGTSVSVLDLYKFVEEKCKGSKIVDCDIFQDQPNVVGDDNDNIDDDDDDDDNKMMTFIMMMMTMMMMMMIVCMKKLYCSFNCGCSCHSSTD